MNINFELKTPFKYAGNGGVEVECNFIELREPTGRVSHICCAIEGLIQSSLLKMADILSDDVIAEAKENAQQAALLPRIEDEKTEKDGDSIIAMMVGSGADMDKMVLHFRELFKEVAFMGGEKKITSARLDDMSHKDLRRMIGVYSANFILN